MAANAVLTRQILTKSAFLMSKWYNFLSEGYSPCSSRVLQQGPSDVVTSVTRLDCVQVRRYGDIANIRLSNGILLLYGSRFTTTCKVAAPSHVTKQGRTLVLRDVMVWIRIISAGLLLGTRCSAHSNTLESVAEPVAFEDRMAIERNWL